MKGKTFEQDIISGDAPPDALRAFYIDGQDQEFKKKTDDCSRFEQDLNRLIELKRQNATEETRERIEDQITEALGAIVEARRALKELRQLHEKIKAELTELSDEKIAQDGKDSPVPTIMKKYHPDIEHLNQVLSAAMFLGKEELE
ncbi:MAG: hypothetical protein ABIG66_00700 [Candidatus Kerfeldbacteria bacterium]